MELSPLYVFVCRLWVSLGKDLPKNTVMYKYNVHIAQFNSIVFQILYYILYYTKSISLKITEQICKKRKTYKLISISVFHL